MTEPERGAAPVVRRAEASDFDEWADLFRAYREFYRLAPDESVVDRVWEWILDDDHEVGALVAERDGRLVGIAHHRRFARPTSATTGLYLDDLFAAPDARGTGVGRALIDALSELAQSRGWSVVRWITASDNVQARRLYDSVAGATPWVTYDLVPGSVRKPGENGEQ
ncbi:GNAT family N-acetyltransferase [Naasia sp. SYSU D00948]|uniref:GNAT family N-acetyltransferase n=1 Tax=Naasia sp. SYSU D00948 TaxID=2817379 RepID=UPI001B30BB2C|nr:GNAT family N-acetyltransferase [Naasia sp. SYSU D00948]